MKDITASCWCASPYPVLCEPKDRVQFATDGQMRMIASVDVTNSGNDHGAMAPLHDDLSQWYDTTPDKYLVDGGFHTKDDITMAPAITAASGPPCSFTNTLRFGPGLPRSVGLVVSFGERGR